MKDFICGNCGAEIGITEDYCTKCGARVVFDSDVRYCSRCGGRLTGNTEFCTNCGQDFSLINETQTGNTNLYIYNKKPAAGNTGAYTSRPAEGFTGQFTEQQTGRPQERLQEQPVELPDNYTMQRPGTNYNTGRSDSRNKATGRSGAKPTGFKAKFAALPASTKVAIIGGAAIILLFIILGIVTLVNNALNVTSPDVESSPPPQTAEPTVSPVVSVQAVTLTYNGVVLSEKDIKTGESITIRVELEPAGIDEEIVWTNRNPDIVELNYDNQKKSTVTVTGLMQGSSRLSVRVGSIEAVCIIRVEDEELPPPEAESIVLVHNMAPLSNVEMLVGESLDLNIIIEPEGVEDEIILTFTTPGIVELKTNPANGTEITVTGKAEGRTILSIVVGNIWYECAFEVLDETWRDAYAEFLRNPANYQKDISDWNAIRETFFEDHSSRFTLRDMDNDGMLELLMVFEAQVGFAQSFILVYTYRQNAVTFIGRFDGSAAWAGFLTTSNSSYPGVFSYGGRMGHFNVNYAEVKNGRLEVTDVAYEEDHSDWGEHVQRTTIYNENLYSEFKSERTVLIEAYEITAVNISRILER